VAVDPSGRPHHRGGKRVGLEKTVLELEEGKGLLDVCGARVETYPQRFCSVGNTFTYLMRQFADRQYYRTLTAVALFQVQQHIDFIAQVVPPAVIT
jgi:hypothetical protein